MSGARCCARAWLLAPAAPEEIRARQEAVEDLRPKLDLREQWGLIAAETQKWIRTEALIGWALTFVAVVFGWVFFRATTLSGRLRIVAGMVGLNPSEPIALGTGDTTLTIAAIWCVALAAIAFLMPNTEELVRHYLPAIAKPARERPSALSFAPTFHWAAAVAVVLAAGLIGLPAPTSFLYFNF